MPEQNTTFSHLAGQQFMSLTTFRKNGKAVATPVWFADVGGRLVVTTDPNSGKVKRLRHTSRVTVAPSKANGTVTGPAVEAVGRILPPEEHAAAQAALKQKYGVQWWLFFAARRLSGRRNRDAAYLEISPPAG